jgi:putative antitoxin of VapBC-like toxin-antitoxin system
MTTVKIPDDVLAEAKKVSQIASTDELVVRALKEFASNHDQRKLVKYLGTLSDDFMADVENEKLER